MEGPGALDRNEKRKRGVKGKADIDQKYPCALRT